MATPSDSTYPYENKTANPSLTAGWVSRLLFLWIFPLIKRGHHKKLEPDDIYDVPPSCSSKTLTDEFTRSWSPNASKSLIISLLVMKWKVLLQFLVAQLIHGTIYVAQPILVTIVVSFLQRPGHTTNAVAYACAAGSVVLAFIGSVADAFHTFGWQSLGMEYRTMLVSAVYKKVLCLSSASFSKFKSGHIITLIASDVEKFHMACGGMGHVMLSFIQIPIIFGLMYLSYGIAAILGVILMVTVFLIFLVLARSSKHIRLQVAKCTDSRVLMMGEILAAMQVIKMYCWEKPFAQVIMKHRRDEIRQVLKMILVQAIQGAMSYNLSKTGVAIMVLYQVWNGGPLELESLIRLIAWWELLKVIGGLILAFQLTPMTELMTSINRIQEFLKSSENAALMTDTMVTDGQCNYETISRMSAIQLKEFTASWGESFNIGKVDITVQKGSLVAIVGPVGAGKTSLLLAMLRELPASEGSVFVSGSLGYVPQEAWIFSDTLRANILFGESQEYDKYTSTIQACCLQPDITAMPQGDLTLVGERGLMLSGGQKARINLARAVYKDADIYLLDDPLSAVDAKVGHHIFDRCIVGYLNKKTRILVTHQLQYLDQVDHIYVVQQGNVIADGTYQDLIQEVNLKSLISWKDEEDKSRPEVDLMDDRTDKVSMPACGATVRDEHQEDTISLATIASHLVGDRRLLFFAVLFLLILAKVAYFGSDAWLSFWQRDYDSLLQYDNLTLPLDVTEMHIYGWLIQRTWVHVLIVVLGLILHLLSLSLLALFLTLVSQKLHDKMFTRVLYTPARFFDTNPIGGILNRFSRDIGFVDGQLSFCLVFLIDSSMYFIGVCVIACAVNPWNLIPTVILIAAVAVYHKLATSALRELKRIEGNCRSPSFSHLSTTIQGRQVIRALQKETHMNDIMAYYQDTHTAAWYLFLAAFRWFGLYCDFLLTVYYTIMFMVVFLLPSGEYNIGLVGISLQYVVGSIGFLQFVIRMIAELEGQMTSVERILQYTQLDQEPAEQTKVLPSDGWPQTGQIMFVNMSLAYGNQTPDVLRNINITIDGLMKVGIVGRTGAGKSSLFAALFRMYEPRGNIWIDGIDITTLGLHDLRQVISVVPQDPVLFSGTLRYNLDPFSEYTDEQIWTALSEVQLRNKLNSMPGGLQADIAEAGGNMSVGERQLMGLARAILRQNRIIIIDEATANVDHKTDELIQKTIREKFRDSTLLCIAHRIDTIIDSHKVMVLDNGRVVEFDHPHLLLQDTAGVFHQMVLHAGQDHMIHLKKIAMEAYHRHMEEAGVIFNHSRVTPYAILPESENDNVIEDENEICESTKL